MDGYKKPKTNKWKGELYSDTRYAVILWLEKELPQLYGSVINVASGGWTVPKQLLDSKKITNYTTFDQKHYGDAKNNVDVIGDVHSMPFGDESFDNLICNQSFECFHNPFQAIKEMHRVLKKGGTLILDAPFNHAWFGYGSNPESLKKKVPVKDYWRITKNGWELLTKDFSQVSISGFGGTGDHDRYVYCIKAKK